jgi:hypothetical protein
VTDFVAEVTEYRSIGLVQLLARFLANGVRCFPDVDGDQAVIVTGEYRLFGRARFEKNPSPPTHERGSM